MKIAHLILAHSNPEQLERLIRALEHSDSYIFLHIDQKAALEDYRSLFLMDRVYQVERVKVGWGAYSIVQATVNGLRAIATSGVEFGYINFLSGSDYPLKSPDEIHAFFEQQNGQNFMEFQLVMQDWKEAIGRITEYHLTDYEFAGKYFVQKWINRLLPTRKIPERLVPVGRSQWMSITMDAGRYIMDYLAQHSNVVSFFKHTWAPDEMIFQTILYNSDFRDTLVNNNLRYIEWQEGKASPETFREKDLEKLLASNALFARKFDMTNHPGVLNQLDKRIFIPK